jgi:hypothetical protein
MTRKDYRAFAEVIKEGRSMNGTGAITYIAIEIAKVFRNDNPQFRPVQFFKACGYEDSTLDYLSSKL